MSKVSLTWIDKKIPYGDKVEKVARRMGLVRGKDYTYYTWLVLGGRRKVLIVDDRQNYRALFRKIKGSLAERHAIKSRIS